ncbi:MAG: DUF2075 domain-containing protein [Betaproteobacteria bacterium]|nr:DUF2075 domain-containing protein [Betaproteobacteria bacterium]
MFLSGNGPLVEVLQYELKGDADGGKTFVRGVKDYVKYYSVRGRVPAEHVLVYDEAQRAYDAAMVASKHPDMATTAKSEPELFVEFAERVPEWCVVVGLIGGGQEIHVGEEAGTIQWADAIKASPQHDQWTVHGPASFIEAFSDTHYIPNPVLNLDKSLRSHLSEDLHKYVADIVSNPPGTARSQAELADVLAVQGYDFRITRDLEVAKDVSARTLCRVAGFAVWNCRVEPRQGSRPLRSDERLPIHQGPALRALVRRWRGLIRAAGHAGCCAIA